MAKQVETKRTQEPGPGHTFLENRTPSHSCKSGATWASGDRWEEQQNYWYLLQWPLQVDCHTGAYTPSPLSSTLRGLKKEAQVKFNGESRDTFSCFFEITVSRFVYRGATKIYVYVLRHMCCLTDTDPYTSLARNVHKQKILDCFS